MSLLTDTWDYILHNLTRKLMIQINSTKQFYYALQNP